ncbi:ABC transporter permease [Flaviflexus massiliensis]|uniref:ABC transporter permease n=1 Tax=Flaviflexus massiliensis TaxID=1522309 RepID=UPI0006D59437|nr:ABC transporter permease [Flaviflexus massiliensis]
MSTTMAQPQRYRPTPMRLMRSELRKLTSLRSTWALSIVAGLLYLLIAFFVAQSAKDVSESFPETSRLEMFGSSYMVTNLFQLLLLFGISFGTMVMTSEYSHNTIQTSLLASRSRLAFFGSKLAVLAVFWAAVTGVILILAVLLIQGVLSGSIISLPLDDATFWLSVLICVLVLVMGAVMSAALGAVMRSTVGTITTMFGLVLILPIIELIPLDFIENLRPYFPINVMTAAIAPRDGDVDPVSIMSSDSLDPNVALGVLAIYTVIFIVLGAISIKRRDA